MDSLQQSSYLCHPAQRCTLRRVEVLQGMARGMEIIEVATAGGLQIDLLPDTGLDIGQVRYKGVNMTFLSKNGYVSPMRMLPYEDEFLHTFPGGLLYTCGLRSTGPAHRDGGEWHPLHGRFHSLSADEVSATEEGGVVTVTGVVRETALFGHCLEMRRCIRIPVDGAAVTVTDRLTNLTPKSEEYALLYHCNFGYPFVSEAAHVCLPEGRKTTPRTPFAATGLGRETTFDPPKAGEEERVFFHEEMEHRAAIENPALGLRAELTYSENLPILAHWRSMAAGDYVCGLEPTNCYIMGRGPERAHGTLPVLSPFETVETSVTFTFSTL